MSINFTPHDLEQIVEFAKTLDYGLASSPHDSDGRRYSYTVTMRDGVGEPAVWITIEPEGEPLIRFAPEGDDIKAQNLRVLKHEAETPMRGHDPDGACCRRAEAGDDR